MIRFAKVIAVAGLFVVCSTAPATAQITIPTVTIGDPGNASDPLTGDFYGSVAYTYNIGQTEVTNAQYAAFLNAVAASDPFGLYNIQMGDAFGGITRSGSPGSYTYSTISGRTNHPVNFVSFWDATRFANWVHNGQGLAGGSGDTETGAYTLTPDAVSGNTVTRNAGWRWAVTSENEWYKAAYYQPASAGGDNDNFWFYPTSSNTAPSATHANFLGDDTKPVSSYAPNFYGVFDMAGNVSEWNEAIFTDAGLRGVRGGSFSGISFEYTLKSDYRSAAPVLGEDAGLGFRVSAKMICRADFNTVNGLTVQDIFDFLAAYFAGNPAQANFNGDCCLTVQDIFDFLAAYFAGCP